jgi:YHS domain-containing protein
MKIFATSTTNTVVDPVCGMRVDPCKTELISVYEEKHFYFCAEGCRKAFEKSPEKYISANPSRRKGWWGRYLARLNKATDGKAIKCH